MSAKPLLGTLVNLTNLLSINIDDKNVSQDLDLQQELERPSKINSLLDLLGWSGSDTLHIRLSLHLEQMPDLVNCWLQLGLEQVIVLEQSKR